MTSLSLAASVSDTRRTVFLEHDDWRVVRFQNAEVYDNLHGDLETITRAAWENENWLKHRG